MRALPMTRGAPAINAFFAEFLRDAPGNPPRIVEAPGHTFSDAQQKPNSTTYQYVSLVNLASIEELEKVVRIAVDPLRFRANFYVSGLPAWNEAGLGRFRDHGRQSAPARRFFHHPLRGDWRQSSDGHP